MDFVYIIMSILAVLCILKDFIINQKKIKPYNDYCPSLILTIIGLTLMLISTILLFTTDNSIYKIIYTIILTCFWIYDLYRYIKYKKNQDRGCNAD